jgi:hypothetical protein
MFGSRGRLGPTVLIAGSHAAPDISVWSSRVQTAYLTHFQAFYVFVGLSVVTRMSIREETRGS